jgi:hypothetical protein
VTVALRASITLTRYTSTKALITYQQYLEAKAAGGDADEAAAAALEPAPEAVVVYA